MNSTEIAEMALFESLQKEFCPTLDSSLIAVLLFDLESDIDGQHITSPSDQIETLRATLQELSLQADECSRIEYLSDVDGTLQDQTISSSMTLSSYTDGASLPEDSGSSSTSWSPSFSSSLDFLQMVLPDVPSSELKNALCAHDGEDLWDIIGLVLTEEAIREMEERGLEDEEDEIGWEVIQKKRKESDIKTSRKRIAKKSKKVVLADIRQQHHKHNSEQQPSHLRNGCPPSIALSPSNVDPWTRISSLSSRLAGLLPPHPPTIFSSVLHSPQHATFYDAVRACLKSLCKSDDLSDEQATLLISLLDIIVLEDDELDVEMRSQIISDVELAVCITEGRADDALDLVYLLRDLHIPPSARLNSCPSPLSPSATPFSQGPSSGATRVFSLPAEPPLSPSFRGKPHPPSKQSPNEINAHQWKIVPPRTKSTHSSRYLGPYIPTYSLDVNGKKTARAEFAKHCNGLSATKERNTNDSRLRIRQAMSKSRQALMDAAIMYQKRNSKNHGGEVAVFYAERAREWKQIAKQEAVNAAREMVLAKSERTGKRDVIDLHGTTVAEALVIVREILIQRTESISSGKPLKIITGKGKHSAGRVSVLKPALQSALTKDGWAVTTWDAGIVVHGGS